MFVTLADYERENQVTVPNALREHALSALQSAEDDLLREVGTPFYGDDPTGLPGRDWVRLASWRAAEYLTINGPAFRDAMLSPFQAETQGRYSYTLRTPGAAMLANPRYRPVLDYYRGLVTASVAHRGATAARDEYT